MRPPAARARQRSGSGARIALLLALAAAAPSALAKITNSFLFRDDRALVPVAPAFAYGARGHIDIVLQSGWGRSIAAAHIARGARLPTAASSASASSACASSTCEQLASNSLALRAHAPRVCSKPQAAGADRAARLCPITPQTSASGSTTPTRVMCSTPSSALYC